MKLEKGAKVKVRLRNLTEKTIALYLYPHPVIPKSHWVSVNEVPLIAGKFGSYADCRFIGSPCDHVPVGVSV